MKKLISGMGLIICGLVILCTDYIVNRVIGSMPGVYLVEGVAVFSLSAIGMLIMSIGVIIYILGYKDK